MAVEERRGARLVMHARLWAAATALLIFFFVLAGFQAYWQLVAGPWLMAQPYDHTAAARVKLVQPGSVITRDGVKILGPARANGSWSYKYERPEEFAHLLGYNEQTGLRGALTSAAGFAGAAGLRCGPHHRQQCAEGRLRGPPRV